MMFDEVSHHHREVIKSGEAVLDEFRRMVISRALGYVGAKSIKYQTPLDGMTPEDGFDCSGFVVRLFEEAQVATGTHISIPRHANEQWREFGEYVAYDRREQGDLVFFPSRKKAGIRIVGHVGVVLDNESYIHAPGKDETNVRIDSLPEQQPLQDIHPKDIYTHSPVGIKRISLPFGDGRWHVY